MDLKALVSAEHVPVAPTKKPISLRTYSVRRRLNRLSLSKSKSITLSHFAVDLKALVSAEHVPVAPTKEQISLRTYSVRRRLNRLRRDACALFTSDNFVAMTIKLEREVNCGRIALRADRNVFADLGKEDILVKI